MFDDGTYDALVVDAEHVEGGREVRLHLVITAGARKGDVVTVRAEGLADDPLDLLGLPATLVVAGGAPRVNLER